MLYVIGLRQVEIHCNITAVRLGVGRVLFQWKNQAFKSIIQGFRIYSIIAQTKYKVVTMKYSHVFIYY